MGLFSPPLSYDSNLMEATVTNVDPVRFVCSVKTVRGQYLNEVPWLLPTGGSGRGGMHFTPCIGDQVVVSTALTYPLIIGSLPRLGTPSSSLSSLSGSDLALDAGNSTNMKNGYVTNPEKPGDLVPGDFVFTNDTGGLLGLLANGSAMIRASALAQIFVSRFDDLVRVVARNWERFSDVGQQTVANVSGRLYEYLGWDRSMGRSKVGIYELQDVIGDVAAGEVLKGEPNSSTGLPVADNRVRKYWLTDQSGNSRMIEILYDGGKLDILVSDALGTTNTREVQDNNVYQVTSTGTASNSKVTITPTDITCDYNGGASKTVWNATGITATHGQGSHVLNDSSVTSTYGSGTHVLNSSSVTSTFGGHSIAVDASGVHLS